MELALRCLSIQSMLTESSQDLLDMLNVFLLVPGIDKDIIKVYDANGIN
jgi:hypothetical protein